MDTIEEAQHAEGDSKGRTVYQGRGASLENIYGPEAVESGRAVPLFGPGQYYTFTEADAKAYGAVTSHSEPTLTISGGKRCLR